MSLLDQADISETTKVDSTTLPLILVGPILRRATADELVIWLVCADPIPLRLCCYWDGERRLDMEFPSDHAGHLRIGAHAHLHLLTLRPPDHLPVDRWIEYDIALLTDSGHIWLSEEFPNLTYPGEARMRFVIKTRIDELLFGSCRKPIFTTDSAHNHLVTLAEVLAMYLLVWSPQLWRLVDLTRPALVDEEFSPQYEQELGIVEAFVEGLPQIQRALAAVPTYMIFDDHDVTDDWNLTRGWEESAYGHPYSRRIIGTSACRRGRRSWRSTPGRSDGGPSATRRIHRG